MCRVLDVCVTGDSACSLPAQTIPADVLKTVREWTLSIAKELKVVGLINIQFAIQDDIPYIIEANPRASRYAQTDTTHTQMQRAAGLSVRTGAAPNVHSSAMTCCSWCPVCVCVCVCVCHRTVPFVAKAVGHPIAKYASLLMSGRTLADVGLTEEPKPDHVAVKEVVLPFRKFAGCDTLLGPEMRSTGEVSVTRLLHAQPLSAQACVAAICSVLLTEYSVAACVTCGFAAQCSMREVAVVCDVLRCAGDGY